jgi:hypothetical protein
MPHKSVTKPDSELENCPYDCNSAPTCPYFKPYPPEEIVENDREYRRLTFELDTMRIDPWVLKYFLWHTYQPLRPELMQEKYWFFRKAFKHCRDCKHIWFISVKRDMAWKFIPTEETRAALSKPLGDFLANYPIENDLRFVKNKKIIRKVLTDDEDREDTVFFDIIHDDIYEHCRPEYEGYHEVDPELEYYDKFNPAPPALLEIIDYEGSYRCKYCGKELPSRRFGQNCCSAPACRKKRFIEQRRQELAGKKILRKRANVENPTRCLNCNGILPETARPNQKFCGLNCRVEFHRKRKILV